MSEIISEGTTETKDLVSIAEATIAASVRPVSERELAGYLPEGTDVAGVMADLTKAYEGRGIVPARTAGGWAFRTRQEASGHAVESFGERHRIGRAATETLACIALFGPLTRSEIERVRGVALSKGTMDALLTASLIRPGPRRNGPGRPLTWVTTERFLELYDLESTGDIPQWREVREEGLDDLRLTAGLIDGPMEEEEPTEEDHGDPFDDEMEA